MVLFGQMESAANLTSVVAMAEGLQWATLQISAPFGEDDGSTSSKLVGSLFWWSPVLLLAALHWMVTMHYADRLPLILCFPAIEILLMQAGFGSITTAAAVVLNPKEPTHWGYTLVAAVVMTAAVGWTGFVLVWLWLHCSDAHLQCSYTVLSDSSESQTPPEGVASKLSILPEGSEGENNRMQDPEGASPPKACQLLSCGLSCQASTRETVEAELANTDAATEELLKLRTLFLHAVVPPVGPIIGFELETSPRQILMTESNPGMESNTEPERFKVEAFPDGAMLTKSDAEMDSDDQHAVVQPVYAEVGPIKDAEGFELETSPRQILTTESTSGMESDTEPEPFKLEAFPDDAILTGSDAEIESDDQQDDTWAGCWQKSGWGERGIWGGGAEQVEAEHCFDEMKVS